MTATDRHETSRTACKCGKGEFVFYSCELDGWSYVNNPNEKWYEMHIFCDNCVSLFKKYNPIKLALTGEKDRWRINIPIPDTIPDNQ